MKRQQKLLSEQSDNSPFNQVHNSKPISKEDHFESALTLHETIKTPEKSVTTKYQNVDDQATTNNKSLHPATPSFIKFDFDEDGEYYSNDSDKQQQEVLNYLMLGAKQASQQSQKQKERKDSGKMANATPGEQPSSSSRYNSEKLADGDHLTVSKIGSANASGAKGL